MGRAMSIGASSLVVIFRIALGLTLRVSELVFPTRAMRRGDEQCTLEGILRYREVEDEVKCTTFKHKIAEVHAISMKRLSKVEAGDDPTDGADDE